MINSSSKIYLQSIHSCLHDNGSGSTCTKPTPVTSSFLGNWVVHTIRQPTKSWPRPTHLTSSEAFLLLYQTWPKPLKASELDKMMAHSVKLLLKGPVSCCTDVKSNPCIPIPRDTCLKSLPLSEQETDLIEQVRERPKVREREKNWGLVDFVIKMLSLLLNSERTFYLVLPNE